MKRKIAITIICLFFVLLLVACGNKNDSTDTTEADSFVEVSESTETEVVETESQETQGKETENFDNYKELESVPVDGRDGSKEHPYQVGDTIYFPKVFVAYNVESLEAVYTSLTVVVEEATSEYVKISYKFGVDSWEELDWENWSGDDVIWLDKLFYPFKFDGENNQLGNPLSIVNSLNDDSETAIFEADKTEGTLYYQGDDGKGCTEDTAYLMLIYYLGWSVPEEEQYEYFNCTFVEMQ